MPDEFLKCDNDVCSQGEGREIVKEERQEDKEPKAHMLTYRARGRRKKTMMKEGNEQKNH
jgi:hypothetical protein